MLKITVRGLQDKTYKGEVRAFFRDQVRQNSFWTVLFWLAAALLWALLAPQQFGGQVGYVIVNGKSMTPLFQQGGLVLVRHADQYQIGDVVTYLYPNLGPVIHRVVGRNGERYILKGDANGWLDGYQPEACEIIGKYWVYFPGAGQVLANLRSPGWMALLVGIGTVMFGLPAKPLSKSRLKRRLQENTHNLAMQTGRFFAGGQESYFFAVFSLGLAALLLSLFAFTRPIHTTRVVEVPYEQMGLFAYSAAVPEGVYDENRLNSGQVIFPQLNCNIDFFFFYNLTGAADIQASGSYQLVGTISDSRGWQRTFDLQPRQVFSGSSFKAQGMLDICAAQKMIEQFQEVAGISSGTYLLSISPNVELSGVVNGLPLAEQFAPQLTFALEPTMVYMSAGRDSGQSALQPSQKGLLSQNVTVDNTLPIFRLALPVRTARWMGGLGLLLALALYGWGEFSFRRVEASDPRLLVKFLSGQDVVEISPPRGADALLSGTLVEICQLKDLVRIANSLGTAVQVFEEDQDLHFLVRDLGTLYHVRQAKPAVLLGEVSAA